MNNRQSGISATDWNIQIYEPPTEATYHPDVNLYGSDLTIKHSIKKLQF